MIKDDVAILCNVSGRNGKNLWGNSKLFIVIYSKFIRVLLVMYSFDHTFIIYDSVTETWYVTWWIAAGADPANKVRGDDFSNIW